MENIKETIGLDSIPPAEKDEDTQAESDDTRFTERRTPMASTTSKKLAYERYEMKMQRMIHKVQPPNIDVLTTCYMNDILNEYGMSIVNKLKDESDIQRIAAAKVLMNRPLVKTRTYKSKSELLAQGLAPPFFTPSALLPPIDEYDLSNIGDEVTTKEENVTPQEEEDEVVSIDSQSTATFYDASAQVYEPFYGSPIVAGLDLPNDKLRTFKCSEEEFESMTMNAMRLSASVKNLSSDEYLPPTSSIMDNVSVTMSRISQYFTFKSDEIETEPQEVPTNMDETQPSILSRLRPRKIKPLDESSREKKLNK